MWSGRSDLSTRRTASLHDILVHSRPSRHHHSVFATLPGSDWHRSSSSNNLAAEIHAIGQPVLGPDLPQLNEIAIHVVARVMHVFRHPPGAQQVLALVVLAGFVLWVSAPRCRGFRLLRRALLRHGL